MDTSSKLNLVGALFMAFSWLIVLGLNFYTFYKILYNTEKNKEN